MIERTVGKFDFQFAHRSGAKVGTQEAHAKSGADVGDEMIEATFGVIAFGGVSAPLFEDRLEDEVVKTAADEKLVDQFEFNPVVAVTFCRIDDNTNTGWTYLNRNGETEIANAEWVETGGRLEQQTTDYDFPRDDNGNDPVLGAIALAPRSVGGHYSIAAEFTSLEPGNQFQDQDFVFGYVDEDNFFMLETIPSGLNVFYVVEGDRVLIQSVPFSHTHDPTITDLQRDAETGALTLTWTSEAEVLYTVSRSRDLELWDDLEDSAVGQEGTTTFEDTPGFDKAFYRVERTPLAP